MLTLPLVAPVVETVASVRLSRDYSLDPVAIGQLVGGHTPLTEVIVRRAGRTRATRHRCRPTRQAR